jgi:hypothetical protein
MKSNRVTVYLIAGVLFAVHSFGNIVASAAPPSKEDSFAGLMQNWDKNLPSPTRFNVLASFNNQAVRDDNTGLVWEKTPSSTLVGWESAGFDCLNKNVGGTRGWRLPSIVELASLINPTLPPPYVPTSIFTVQIGPYWSETTAFRGVTTRAYYVDLQNALASDNYKTEQSFAWCVRGPMNADQY